VSLPVCALAIVRPAVERAVDPLQPAGVLDLDSSDGVIDVREVTARDYCALADMPRAFQEADALEKVASLRDQPRPARLVSIDLANSLRQIFAGVIGVIVVVFFVPVSLPCRVMPEHPARFVRVELVEAI